ncbi:MAG: class I SAM-dependent methyltransferase [Gemmatimonadales bacterium]
MMYTRYTYAAELARGRRVLELGCGSGQGLGLVGRTAARLVGGDLSSPLLRAAQAHYGGRFPLARLSAERLPFADGAFDLVLLFEASYYVPHMDAAFREIARVVVRGGVAVFVNANPERPDFIASPHSVHYHTADEFRAAFGAVGFVVTVEGAFPVEARTARGPARWVGALVSLARWILQKLALVPRTLQGRARLKRVVYGKLRRLPPELPPGFAEVAPRVPLVPGPARDFKVIYVTARRPVRGDAIR